LKAFSGLLAFVAPVTAQVPAGAQFREIIAILIILAACFIAGIVVRTGPGARGIRQLQSRVLEKIPGYKLLRSLITRLSGDETAQGFIPVLAEIEDALVPALIVEELADGECVVLVPSVPTPVAGALYILPAARVHRIDVPLAQIFTVYSKWGEGAGELVAAMRAVQRKTKESA
ncbi:MAG: hypothetical protein OEV14_08905, partial [Gammaproteobacteria bacterium]|nr:hypothetical protein [Gammaproteobacteria bacterium]